MIREIPEGSIEIQPGLWLYDYQSAVIGTGRKLYSSEGYCFYDNDDEIYDEEGNLVAPEDVQSNQRMYMQYAVLARMMSTWTREQLNAKYISVSVQDGHEIVSAGQSTETVE